MLEQTLTSEEARRLAAMVDAAKRVVLTCHVNPDGDAIGSVAALLTALERRGKEALGVVPNFFPDYLKHIPCADRLVMCDKTPERAAEAVEQADLIFCLDYNGLKRLGEPLAERVAASCAQKVMIDHHLDPEAFCDLTVSRPEMCSTCEVLLHVMNELGWTEGLTRNEAAALYAGMMTDTGAFTYASSRPEVYECISLLLRTGIDKDKIYRDIYWTCTEGKFRLMGYLLYVKMEVMKERHAAMITLTNQEYRRFQVRNGDTEGFVNIPLQIDGIKLSIFLREDTEVKGKIRVSTRSVDDFPCNELCAEFFNGGGHKNASGGWLMCSIDEAAETARRALKKYEPFLNPKEI